MNVFHKSSRVQAWRWRLSTPVNHRAVLCGVRNTRAGRMHAHVPLSTGITVENTAAAAATHAPIPAHLVVSTLERQVCVKRTS
jgi:hypothetical protein